MNKRQVGFNNEHEAVLFLQNSGYNIRETNFYCKSGEIDIIADDEDIHQILISALDKDEAQYIPYIIFNLRTKGVEDDWTSYIAQRVYEELNRDVGDNELAL